jgi:hypothetical protein
MVEQNYASAFSCVKKRHKSWMMMVQEEGASIFVLLADLS